MKKILSKLTVFVILLSAFSCSKVELYEPWDEFLEGLESASGGGEDTVRTFGVETVDVGTNTVRLKGTISADVAEEYESYGFFCYEYDSFSEPVCDYDAIMEGVIFYDSDNVDLADGTATVLIDGLEPGTEYVCCFCAYDRYGIYEKSSMLIFTTAYY